MMFSGVLRLCRNERFFSNIVGDDVLGVPKRMKLISPMAMQKSLFHKNSRHLTTANAYVSGRRGRRPLQGWRVRFRCRVAISNQPTNQNLNNKKRTLGGGFAFAFYLGEFSCWVISPRWCSSWRRSGRQSDPCAQGWGRSYWSRCRLRER